MGFIQPTWLVAVIPPYPNLWEDQKEVRRKTHPRRKPMWGLLALTQMASPMSKLEPANLEGLHAVLNMYGSLSLRGGHRENI